MNKRCDVCVSDEVHYERTTVSIVARPANYCPECGRRLRPTVDQELKESDGFVPDGFIELHKLNSSRLSLISICYIAGMLPEHDSTLLCFSDATSSTVTESYNTIKRLIAEAQPAQ